MNEWITEAELRAAMDKVLEEYLKPRLIQQGVDPESDWLNTLGYEINGESIQLTAADYTHYMAEGRAPGKRPPIAPLIEWTVNHFKVDRRQARNIAFAIAQKIKKEGTEAYQHGGIDIEGVLKDPEVTNRLSEQIEPLIRKRVEEKVKGIIEL